MELKGELAPERQEAADAARKVLRCFPSIFIRQINMGRGGVGVFSHTLHLRAHSALLRKVYDRLLSNTGILSDILDVPMVDLPAPEPDEMDILKTSMDTSNPFRDAQGTVHVGCQVALYVTFFFFSRFS